jgi:hypothetical protein
MAKRQNNTTTRRKRKRLEDKGVDTCFVCHLPLYKNTTIEANRTSLEHIIPLKDGGSNEEHNLSLSHVVCNTYKDDNPRAISMDLLNEAFVAATMYESWLDFDESVSELPGELRHYMVGMNSEGVAEIVVGPYHRQEARRQRGIWKHNHPDLVWRREKRG